MVDNHKDGRENASSLSARSVGVPSTTANAHALRQYNIDFQLEKAKRLAIKMHSFPGLFPEDRELIIQLQLALKKAKKFNGYDPNTKLEHFPP